MRGERERVGFGVLVRESGMDDKRGGSGALARMRVRKWVTLRLILLQCGPVPNRIRPRGLRTLQGKILHQKR